MRPSGENLAVGGSSLVAGLVIGALAAGGGDELIAPRGPDSRDIVVHQVDERTLRLTTEQVPAGAIVSMPADMPADATITNVLFVGPASNVWAVEGVERTAAGIVLRARNTSSDTLRLTALVGVGMATP